MIIEGVSFLGFAFYFLLSSAFAMIEEPPLAQQVGRNEVRIWSAAYVLPRGRTIEQIHLIPRLKRLGYRRVRTKPVKAGTYFWGNTTFWIYQHQHRLLGKDFPARLFGLRLRAGKGTILGMVDHAKVPIPEEEAGARFYLEPELIAESWRERRLPRQYTPLDAIPESVWRCVLAAEDARFFDHLGLDGRGIARSLSANIKAGKVVQGGSTITQQLVKIRDLTPKRTLGRKMSEAVRALAIEAEYDKRDILETYLNHVYLGHRDGTHIYGYAAAAEAFFGKTTQELGLQEGAALAAMVQGPNRYSPVRNPKTLTKRRNWVLARMEELGWATSAETKQAKAATIKTVTANSIRPLARHFRSWLHDQVQAEYPRRFKRGKGLVVESSLDAQLQRMAEEAVTKGLATLRRDYASLRRTRPSAALIAMDTRNGDILAYVGGDPLDLRDDYDRGRQARRQPGSLVKPFVLLAALDGKGKQGAAHLATRVADEPLVIDLPSGPWAPENNDDRFHGVIDLRTATVQSYNVPFVRLGRWCGFNRVANLFGEVGLPLPADPGPAFVLGAFEASPLEVVQAYSVFANLGQRLAARPILRTERPKGRRLHKHRVDEDRVTRPGSAFLVRQVLKDVVSRGTGRNAALDHAEVAGKTGTSSNKRDAWFAGTAGSIVCVVWVGLDKDGRLGLGGSRAAAPIWRRFMRQAVPAREKLEVEKPFAVHSAYVNRRSGQRVREGKRGAEREWFRGRVMPGRKRFWKRSDTEPIIR